MAHAAGSPGCAARRSRASRIPSGTRRATTGRPR
jgi:hypothetical protein